MADLNKVQLMGRLTFEPELRRIPSGSAVTELRMAVNRSWKDKNDEWKEEVLYIDATVWGAAAERACNTLHKGNLIFVEGSLKMDQWDDKATGEKRSKIKVNADRVQNLEAKARDEDGPRSQGGNERQPQAESRSGPPQGRGPAPQGRGGGGYNGQGGQGRTVPVSQAEVDAFQEDDIPFARPREFDVIDYFGGSVFEGEL
ncbi:MAG: single-stranded DNA-binding protein [Candidatus Pacebacteria bacterium]|nr:single-stranded DNA-binding protein [Candidatus Paceibacterota bacterium]